MAVPLLPEENAGPAAERTEVLTVPRHVDAAAGDVPGRASGPSGGVGPTTPSGVSVTSGRIDRDGRHEEDAR